MKNILKLFTFCTGLSLCMVEADQVVQQRKMTEVYTLSGDKIFSAEEEITVSELAKRLEVHNAKLGQIVPAYNAFVVLDNSDNPVIFRSTEIIPVGSDVQAIASEQVTLFGGKGGLTTLHGNLKAISIDGSTLEKYIQGHSTPDINTLFLYNSRKSKTFNEHIAPHLSKITTSTQTFRRQPDRRQSEDTPEVYVLDAIYFEDQSNITQSFIDKLDIRNAWVILPEAESVLPEVKPKDTSFGKRIKSLFKCFYGR